MWIIILLAAIGFLVGLKVDLSMNALNVRYIALGFLALLDSFTFSLTRDFIDRSPADSMALTRLLTTLIAGAFVIYFGEKIHLDLTLVALIPLGIGFAINLYKFLPK